MAKFGSYDLVTAAAGQTILAKDSTHVDGTVQIDVGDLIGGGTPLPPGSRGAVMYHDGIEWKALGAGTSGQFLKTLGSGEDPEWATPSGGGGTVVHRVADQEALALQAGAVGEYAYTYADNTLYAYTEAGTEYEENYESVVSTPAGGDTRWLAIGGLYNVNGKQSNVAFVSPDYHFGQEYEHKYPNLETAVQWEPEGTTIVFTLSFAEFYVDADINFTGNKLICAFSPEAGTEYVTIRLRGGTVGGYAEFGEGIIFNLAADVDAVSLTLKNSYFYLNLVGTEEAPSYTLGALVLDFRGGTNRVYITNFDDPFYESEDHIRELYLTAQTCKVSGMISSVGDVFISLTTAEYWCDGLACSFFALSGTADSFFVPNYGYGIAVAPYDASIVPEVSKDCFCSIGSFQGVADLLISVWEPHLLFTDSFFTWTYIIGSADGESYFTDISGKVKIKLQADMFRTNIFTGMGGLANPVGVMQASIYSGAELVIDTSISDSASLFTTCTNYFDIVVGGDVYKGAIPVITFTGYVYRMNFGVYDYAELPQKIFLSLGYLQTPVYINFTTQLEASSGAGDSDVRVVHFIKLYGDVVGAYSGSKVYVNYIDNSYDVDFQFMLGDMTDTEFRFRYTQSDLLTGQSNLVLNGNRCSYYPFGLSNGTIILSNGTLTSGAGQHYLEHLVGGDAATAQERLALIINSDQNKIVGCDVYSIEFAGSYNTVVGMTVASNTWTDLGSGNLMSPTSNIGGPAYIDLKEAATPDDPNTSTGRLYVKDAAGVTKLYFRDPAGTETDLLADASGAFTSDGTTITETAAEYDVDFLVGSPTLADDGNVDHDKRMFFDKANGSFRAGEVTGGQWDAAVIGIRSVAFGYNNQVSGQHASAHGASNTTPGDNSHAMGASNVTYGTLSVAIGGANTTSGDYSVTLGAGHTTAAAADYSVCLGQNCDTVGTWGVAMGYACRSDNIAAIAMGEYAKTEYDGSLVLASGRFAAQGDNGLTFVLVRAITTGITPEIMKSGSAATGTLIINNNTICNFKVTVLGTTTGLTAYAKYTIEGVIVNAGGVMSFPGGIPTVIAVYESDPAWDVTVATGVDTLDISVIGAAATDIRWVASVEMLKLYY
jgi:hypothetical protein